MQDQQHENQGSHQIYEANENEQQFQLNYYQEQQNDTYQLQLHPPILNSQSSQYSQPPILTYSYSGISNASSTPQFTLHSSRVSEQIITTFNFIKVQKLYNSIQKLVKQVKQALNLQEDIILYLLYKYQWSKQKMYQNYYDYTAKYLEINQVLKNRYSNVNVNNVNVNVNFNNFNNVNNSNNSNSNQMSYGICQICQNQTKLCSSLLCSHKYCMDCWRHYIRQQLKKNTIFFKCMNKCQCSFVLLHTFVQKIFPQLFQLYRKIVCMNYATYNKSISYCPSSKGQCQLFCQKADSNYQMFVQCLCGQFYCFYCRKQPHYPATCDDVTKWLKLLNDQQSNNKWIQKNTRNCPNCKNSVQKYIGCSKIKCICGAEFCYQCNAKWDQSHKSVKGQCSSLVRKSSLQQRSTTSDFLKLHEKCLAIDRTNKKYLQIVKFCFQQIKQDWVLLKFHGISREISEAWLSLKWASITTFIYKRNQVESFVQDQFIESIGRLLQTIERVKNHGNMLTHKDLLGIGDQILHKAQILKKNKQVWLEAWRNCL